MTDEFLKISQNEVREIKDAVGAMMSQIAAGKHISEISNWLGKIVDVINAIYDREPDSH
jgi:hypothetical protein